MKHAPAIRLAFAPYISASARSISKRTEHNESERHEHILFSAHSHLQPRLQRI